jgi:hypothetical protein
MNAARSLFVIATACIAVVAAACEGFSFNEPGQITVRNISDSETAVLAVIADDVKSYPTLVAGANANVVTSVGGSYTVTVIMSGIDAQTYRSNLQTLRSNVLKVVDGTASSDEKVRFFTYLAEINQAIAQVQNGGASCTGKINLSEDKPASVSAQVAWVRSLGSGFWSLPCSSN